MLYKRIVVLMLSLSLLFSLPGQALERPTPEEAAIERVKKAIVLYLDSPYTLVKGEKKVIEEMNLEICPIEKGGRTLLPLRFVSEGLGAKVAWDATTNTATVVLNQKTVKISIGKDAMTINDQITKLDVPAEIISERTYVPLRALVEALDKKVFFDSNLIVISDQENIIDKSSEETLLDELIFMCTGRGNSASNLMSYNDAARIGDWVFYTNSVHNDQLYKSKIDGTKIGRVSSDKAQTINVIGNWLYYLVPAGTKKVKLIGNYEFTDYIFDIYKIKTDGTRRTKISQEKSLFWLSVIGNWIYYVNEDHHIMKIKVDGTDRTQISNDIVAGHRIAVHNGWIYYDPYYVDGVQTYGFYRIHTDGQNKMKITNEMILDYDITNEWIFYSVPSSLMKMKLDGSEITEIRDDCYPENIHVVGEWVYYRDSSEKALGRLYKMKTDGTQRIKLNSQDSLGLSLLGDWIYTRYNWGKTSPMYRLKLDGSNEQMVY